MTFKQLWEQMSIGALTLIVGWSGYQLNKLNETAGKLAEEMIAQKKDTSRNTEEIATNKSEIKDLKVQVQSNTVKIGRLEVKVFGDRN